MIFVLRMDLVFSLKHIDRCEYDITNKNVRLAVLESVNMPQSINLNTLKSCSCYSLFSQIHFFILH